MNLVPAAMHNSEVQSGDIKSKKSENRNRIKTQSGAADLRFEIGPLSFYYKDIMINIMVPDTQNDNPVLCFVIVDMKDRMLLKHHAINQSFINQNILSFNSHIRQPINKLVGYSQNIRGICSSNKKIFDQLQEIVEYSGNLEDGFESLYYNLDNLKIIMNDLIQANHKIELKTFYLDKCAEYVIHGLQEFVDIVTMNNKDYLLEIEELDLIQEINDI